MNRTRRLQKRLGLKKMTTMEQDLALAYEFPEEECIERMLKLNTRFRDHGISMLKVAIFVEKLDTGQDDRLLQVAEDVSGAVSGCLSYPFGELVEDIEQLLEHREKLRKTGI